MRNHKGLALTALGLLLIVAALALVGYNLYDRSRAAASVGQVLEQLAPLLPEETAQVPVSREPVQAQTPGEADGLAGQTEEVEIPDYLLNPEMDMPVQCVDGRDYIGILEIPALALELPVISTWSYPSLKIAPCRYSGSAYKDDLVIAAHNYPSHFGNLKQLQEGDTVRFTDMDGNVFVYAVALWEDLDADAAEQMQSGEWDLTLFTCTTGGQSRLAVRCVRAED